MKKNKLTKTLAILIILALAPIVNLACAKSDDSRSPQGPPPEAVKACEGKMAGDTTSFTGSRGETLTATCKEIEARWLLFQKVNRAKKLDNGGLCVIAGLANDPCLCHNKS